MGTKTYTYKLKNIDEFFDEDIKIVYKQNNCRCSCDCYDDQMELYLDEEGYGSTELSGQIKYIILGLLQKEYIIEEIK